MDEPGQDKEKQRPVRLIPKIRCPCCYQSGAAQACSFPNASPRRHHRCHSEYVTEQKKRNVPCEATRAAIRAASLSRGSVLVTVSESMLGLKSEWRSCLKLRLAHMARTLYWAHMAHQLKLPKLSYPMHSVNSRRNTETRILVAHWYIRLLATVR